MRAFFSVHHVSTYSGDSRYRNHDKLGCEIFLYCARIEFYLYRKGWQ